MGFIIWYKVEFHEQNAGPGGLLSQVASVLPFGASLPFAVSNDVLSGKYILDAEITLTMVEGAKASTFSIVLTNLPADAIDTLKNKQAEGLKNCQPLLVDISLGYFGETPEAATMAGAITSIKDASDQQSGLPKTTIQGEELGAFQLRTKYKFAQSWPTVTVDALLQEIIKDTDVKIANQSHVDIQPQTLKEYTLPGATDAKKPLSAMMALKNFASDATRNIAVPVVITDKTLYIGSSVGSQAAPVHFSPDENLIAVEQKIDQQQGNDENKSPCQISPVINYHVITLGHPGLRVGQQAFLDVDPAIIGNLRITDLKHQFSTSSGYTCDMTVSIVEAGKLVTSNNGASAVANGVQKKAQAEQSQPMDVGEVKTYDEKKHNATLNYGQKPEQKDTAPSIQTKVNDKVQLFNKPFASLFAWHKCGLIVPVYPGMRALLAHNQNLTNDAIVTGFLWPDQPEYTRPKNEPGDYWLCLPTQLDGNNQPTGKGVNDLTDKSGARVIQAKGLHIYVGEKDLPDVGARPSTPDPKTLVIEHESGTKITIANDGVIKIETQGKDISLTNGQGTLKLASSGDISLENSGVTLKLGSTGVEVS